MATFEGPDPLAGVLSPGPEALVALTPAVCARTFVCQLWAVLACSTTAGAPPGTTGRAQLTSGDPLVDVAAAAAGGVCAPCCLARP